MDMILQFIKSVHSFRSMSTEKDKLFICRGQIFCHTQCWNVVHRLEEELKATFQSGFSDQGEIDSICMSFSFVLSDTSLDFLYIPFDLDSEPSIHNRFCHNEICIFL